MSPITAFEDALLERISATFAPGHLRAVASLPGAIDSAQLDLLAPTAPGVFASFLGGTPAKHLPPEVIEARWVIYVITANAGGQTTRRRGDAAAIGAYDIVPALVGALIATPFAGVGAAKLLRVENLWAGFMEKRGLAIFAVTIEIPLELTGEPPTLDDFITFHADYDIPVHEPAGEHEDWLKEPPNLINSRPDAADDVTLPQ
jgi:phage gp37-like protein